MKTITAATKLLNFVYVCVCMSPILSGKVDAYQMANLEREAKRQKKDGYS